MAVEVQSVNSGGTAADNNGGLYYPVNTGTAMTRTGTGGRTTVPISTPVSSLYDGDGAVKHSPIHHSNASPTCKPSSFTH